MNPAFGILWGADEPIHGAPPLPPSIADLLPLPRRASPLGGADPWISGSPDEDRSSAPDHLGFRADDVTRHLAAAFASGSPVAQNSFRKPFETTGPGVESFGSPRRTPHVNRRTLREAREEATRARLRGCYSDGYTAREMMMPLSKNPFDGDLGRAWLRGWSDASVGVDPEVGVATIDRRLAP